MNDQTGELYDNIWTFNRIDIRLFIKAVFLYLIKRCAISDVLNEQQMYPVFFVSVWNKETNQSLEQIPPYINLSDVDHGLFCERLELAFTDHGLQLESMWYR
jgi:hypothetical protein